MSIKTLQLSMTISLITILCLYTVIRTSAADIFSNNAQRTPDVLHRRSYFYIGGSYLPAVNEPTDSSILSGQIYVERLVPTKVNRKYPIVMIPGNGMTGTGFLNTPDGRMGWANYFMSQGYEIFIVDQPSRGRSPWQQEIDGPQSTKLTTLFVEQRFTATQRFNLWPQAGLFTQWPGNGSRGDPIFDNFYRSIVPGLVSNEEASQKMQKAGVALLDKIGPVILLTHSQSGQYGWPLADARPELVKAIITIEPMGPPFIEAVFAPSLAARPYGLSEIPLSFYPPIQSASDLQPVVRSSDAYLTCIQQVAPARKLINVSKVPVLVITSESGYHSVYDACSVEFLRSAGVTVGFIYLPDVGVHGNGHLMFMEKNSLDIADKVVHKWLNSVFRATV
ncbi:Alpha/beta hydrolase family-domain-containing protein [Gymnopilus junonius]|uniref:Alpha/beta hydrolase family-domain-containing protein n=1 Tax=Gymnopilus junonius TaxID=109634 RepID=A0A9P5NHV9_GYMJU|nr:Alpha/beta hydrolase family-domain-containing protein [Gymnopilus junonius]